MRLGLNKGDLVLEIGVGSDCDEILRSGITEITGTNFLEGKADEVVDAVLLWWRDDDGDLVDELMDALTFLSETGVIWVLTPNTLFPYTTLFRSDRKSVV